MRDVPVQLRVQASLRARFAPAGGLTRLHASYEGGGLRLMMPRGQAGCDAVMVNTGGGMAGGDRWELGFEAASGASVTLTSQSAERVYRAQAEAASVTTRLSIAALASLFWIPQETILFDGARLQRRIDVTMDPDATLVLAEAMVFGRAAMGETVTTGVVRDRWRVRRGDALVFAEDVRLEGDMAAILDRAACGGGARATATVVMVAPDAEARLDHVRDTLASAAAATDAPVLAAASGWNGVLLIRAAAVRAAAVRHVLCAILPLLCGRPLPRVWQ